jgi:hypothetical protein
VQYPRRTARKSTAPYSGRSFPESSRRTPCQFPTWLITLHPFEPDATTLRNTYRIISWLTSLLPARFLTRNTVGSMPSPKSLNRVTLLSRVSARKTCHSSVSVLQPKNGNFSWPSSGLLRGFALQTSLAKHRKPESLPTAEFSAVWAYTPFIEEHVIEWLLSEFAPPTYTPEQFDELDRLTEAWVEDHKRQAKTPRNGSRTRHS